MKNRLIDANLKQMKLPDLPRKKVKLKRWQKKAIEKNISFSDIAWVSKLEKILSEEYSDDICDTCFKLRDEYSSDYCDCGYYSGDGHWNDTMTRSKNHVFECSCLRKFTKKKEFIEHVEDEHKCIYCENNDDSHCECETADIECPDCDEIYELCMCGDNNVIEEKGNK